VGVAAPHAPSFGFTYAVIIPKYTWVVKGTSKRLLHFPLYLAMARLKQVQFISMLNLQAIRSHCLSKPGTTEERPFGPETLVFKVMGRMFALTGDKDVPHSINLKCDPDDSLALRTQFEGISEGYHMDKRHWITVTLNSDVPSAFVLELINDSYELLTFTKVS
jgi:predicted DNA-binding protein (MmcQ/YjbR family)